MYGVLALLDRHARVVASSRVISTSDGTHVLGTWKVIHTDSVSCGNCHLSTIRPSSALAKEATCTSRIPVMSMSME